MIVSACCESGVAVSSTPPPEWGTLYTCRSCGCRCHPVTIPPKVEIREARGKGRGVFATEFIAAGVIPIVGRALEMWAGEPDERHSFSLSRGSHALLNEPASVLNHSCQPNLGVITLTGVQAYAFRACRDIQPGEELTWHYAMTELERTGIGDCRCGYCVGGPAVAWRDLSPVRRGVLLGYGVAQWLRDLRLPAEMAA